MSKLTKAIFPAMVVSCLIAGQVRAADEAGFPFDVPTMAEISDEAGIRHAYTGPWEFFVGGGVASLDCNGDRMPDVFLAGGDSPAQLFVNRSAAGGALKFEKVSIDIPERDQVKVLGAYPVDLDNDVFMDLVVLRLGETLLLKGLGNCRPKWCLTWPGVPL